MPIYSVTQHAFTAKIIEILKQNFPEYADDIFVSSPLLGYLNLKTKSANAGSKARGAFANHYALYVIIEDYLAQGFADKKNYTTYEGARFSDLLRRQRELPFGSKLQNHALNSRLNDEFKKFYPVLDRQPIIRDLQTQRYWIQEDLLLVKIRSKNGNDVVYNIASVVIEIIDAYIATKKRAFESFLTSCEKIAELTENAPQQAIDFIKEQLKPNVDARIFEIGSETS